MKKVWILGGGIAGIEAAISLRQEGFAVTVVSNRDFLFIHPISIWIPTGEKNFDDVCLPLSELAAAHGFDYIVDDVINVRASSNSFTLKNSGEIRYEYLIIAVGGERLQHEGIENTYSICGRPDDSIKIKSKVEELIKIGGGKIAAGFAGNPIDVTAVRGEPAFEFIFNIHNM
ncbi:MAG TPA: FAD-dependent oxidoreductase, partial [Campylobacterales bacterium]|nr:FAD-dependent oxidoreductase [Campylobacterales bacterium]